MQSVHRAVFRTIVGIPMKVFTPENCSTHFNYFTLKLILARNDREALVLSRQC